MMPKRKMKPKKMRRKVSIAKRRSSPDPNSPRSTIMLDQDVAQWIRDEADRRNLPPRELMRQIRDAGGPAALSAPTPESNPARLVDAPTRRRGRGSASNPTADRSRGFAEVLTDEIAERVVDKLLHRLLGDETL